MTVETFFVFVPPENSPYYTTFDIENGISLLEEMGDIMLSLEDVYSYTSVW